jgi:hypothetical protein
MSNAIGYAVAVLLTLASMATAMSQDHLSREAKRDVARLTARLNADIKRANDRNDVEASAAAGRLLTGIQRSIVGEYVGIDFPIVGKYQSWHDKNWVFEFDQYGAHRESFKGGFNDWKGVGSGEGWAEYKHPLPKHAGLIRRFQAVGNGVVVVRDFKNGSPDRSFIIEKDNNP